MNIKESVPVVSPSPTSKEDTKGRGYFSTKLRAFCFCCLFILPVLSSAQQTTLQEIQTFIQNATPQTITPQTLEANSYFLRFNELGAIYNPDFPTTRNKVFVENFKIKTLKQYSNQKNNKY